MGLSNARTRGVDGLGALRENRFGGAGGQGGRSWPEHREAARHCGRRRTRPPPARVSTARQRRPGSPCRLTWAGPCALAGRRPARPAGGGGGRRGPAARTECAGQANGSRAVAKTHSGESGGSKAGQGRHGDRGTGTVDPRRFRCRSQAGGDREGVPGLAVHRAACYHRCEAKRERAGRSDRWSRASGGRTCPAD